MNEKNSFEDGLFNYENISNLSLTDATPLNEKDSFEEGFSNFYQNSLSNLSDDEVYVMIEEAIENNCLPLLKLIHSHGHLSTLMDIGLIDVLIRSKDPKSEELFEFVLANVPEIYMLIFSNLKKKFAYIVLYGNLVKFKILWDAIGAEKKCVDYLAESLEKASCEKYEHFYDFILSQFSQNENQIIDLDNLKRKAFAHAIQSCNINAMLFMLEKGDASLDNLDGKQKIKALKCAVSNNCVDLVRNVKALLTRGSIVIPSSIIFEAISRDFPEVLDVLLENISDCHLTSIVIYAFSLNKVKVLEYLNTKPGVIREPLLLSWAVTSISTHEHRKFETAVNLGLNMFSKDFMGYNLLTLAVIADDLVIVRYLLNYCAFNPNTINSLCVPYKFTATSTAIYFAKTAEMVQLLAEFGANVNAKFIEETHDGLIIKSKTALHRAASIETLSLFAALIKAGADITITDSLGCDNRNFFANHFNSK